MKLRNLGDVMVPGWLATLLVTLLPFFAACTALGLQPPRNFQEQWAYAQSQVIAFRDASTAALDSGTINSTDMKWVIDVGDKADQMLDLARTAQAAGDIRNAQARLQMALVVINSLETYLNQRVKRDGSTTPGHRPDANSGTADSGRRSQWPNPERYADSGLLERIAARIQSCTRSPVSCVGSSPG